MSDQIDLDQHRIFSGLPLVEMLFSGSTVGLALLDEDLRFVWVNQTLAEMTGISVEAHQRRRLNEVVPELAGELVPAFKRVLTSGEPLIDWELRVETGAMPGETRYWLQNIYPLRDDERIVGLGAVVIDITERKLVEQRVSDAERHASELLHQLQRALVPRAKIDERWKVAWRYRASEDTMTLGGDFLGILERADGTLAMVIGDVAGRGAGAAGLGATLRSAWLGLVHGGAPLGGIPVVLDALLQAQTGGGGVFATACFVEIDPSGSRLEVVSAGHESPLLITPASASPLSLDAGPALGLGLQLGWPVRRLDLSLPASLLLYTDGLTDSHRDRSSPRLGPDGLLARVDSRSLLTEPPKRALDQLLDATLPGGLHDLDDDLAVILVSLN